MLRRLGVLSLALAGVCLLSQAARADTLILFDGRHITGDVIPEGNYYIVRTKLGELHFDKDDVSDWIKGDDAPPPTPPLTPGSAKITPPATETPPPAVTPATITPAPEPAATPAPNTTSSTGAGVAGTAAKPGQADAFEMLTHTGLDAMSAGDNKAARDLFLDANQLDPKSVKVLNALGVVYYRLNDFTHARDMFDHAMQITPNPDSALVINSAAVEMASKSPMRAAKLAKDYLSTHVETDEQVLNVLGTALDQADDQSRKSRFFTEAADFYLSTNSRLEATKPGLKRWGSHWLSAGEADEKMSHLTEDREAFKKLAEQVAAANKTVLKAAAEVDRNQQIANRRPDHTSFELTYAKQKLDEAKAKQSEVQASYNEFSDTKMPFPDHIDPVPPEGTVPVVAEVIPKQEPQQVAVVPDKIAPEKISPEPPHDNPAPPPPPAPPSDAGYTPPPRSRPVVKVQIPVYAAAFPISTDLVITSADVVNGAEQIVLQTKDGLPIKAEIVRTDPDSGLALLRISGARLSYLPVADTFAGGAVQCAGFPTVSIFNPTPEMIDATAPAQSDNWMIKFSRHPRLPGSPLLSGGKVVGVELASRDSEVGSIPAISLSRLQKFLGNDAPLSGRAVTDPSVAMLQVTATKESQ